ncbi:MAG: tetratricopeptide repeat protein [Myxococcota bacterium]
MPIHPDDEATQAKRAFLKGDLRRAAYHVGRALAMEPAHSAWRLLLDQIIATSEDPQELVPLDPDVDAAAAATHAYVLASTGILDHAVDLLGQCIEVTPSNAYLEWLNLWFTDRDVRAEVADDTLMHLMRRVLVKCPKDVLEHEGDHAHLARLVEHLDRAIPDPVREPLLASLLSSLHRKLGRLDRALVLARASFEADARWQTAVPLAIAHRMRGDLDAALHAYRAALELDPDELSVRLDIADMLCAHGRLGEGLAALEAVLEREPEHPWALPHALYYRCLVHQDTRWREALHAYTHEHPRNFDAVQLLRSLDVQLSPFVGYLPEPGEALIHLMRSIEQDPDEDFDEPIEISVSALEAPSARLALEQYFIRRFGEARFELEIQHIQTPDPRYPVGPVAFLLWSYVGADAQTPLPNMAAPPDHIFERVRAIAERPYTLDAWLELARGAAKHLGPGDVEGLLAAMIHPTIAPEEFPTWTWIQRIQVAAALLIANLDEPWHGSRRKAALTSLVRGPMDWVVDAAVLALTEIALDDDHAAEDIFDLFADLLESISRDAYCCYEYTLVCNMLRLPFLDDLLRDELVSWKEALEAPPATHAP